MRLAAGEPVGSGGARPRGRLGADGSGGRRGWARPCVPGAARARTAPPGSSARRGRTRGSLYSAPLVAALLAAPAAWPRPTIDRAVAAAAGVRGLLPALAASEPGTLATGLVVAALALARRRWAAATFGAALAGAAGIRVAGGGADAATALVSVAVVASCALLVGSRRPLTSGGVSRLIIDLGQLHDARSFERRLADALGDPGLELRYRLSAAGRWLDAAGRPVRAPDRAETLVEARRRVRGGAAPRCRCARPIPLEGSGAAGRAARGGAALRTADAAAPADQLAASRRRLVTAAERERERFAAEVETGPGALADARRPARSNARPAAARRARSAARRGGGRARRDPRRRWRPRSAATSGSGSRRAAWAARSSSSPAVPARRPASRSARRSRRGRRGGVVLRVRGTRQRAQARRRGADRARARVHRHG